ncbi:tetratricopeptide repeat protein [Pontivivens ytuae]|uniref:Tetratricopeptide repeat protein n=1 Tax=Pontivivens ytuae TaxID=2789856 RepID=A0A7S9LQH6_9RHOB|nr:tetratricopeptide repeat protein [Pontivivens ytuae]QPH53429.1 tetratricopeptide repeat protein [Pontivivens ytuae]
MRQGSIALASLAVALAFCAPAHAEQSLPELMAELADPEAQDVAGIENEIIRRWSQSGSPAMDLLVRRGQDAIESSDFAGAVEHFTAAIDHAPDFAEAYNGRATAYFLQEEYGLALEDVEAVLALNEQHFGALAGLGFIMERLGEEALAWRAFRMAQALNPHQDAVNDAILRLDPVARGTEL